MAWTWVEPFAGAAACALRLVGGRDLAPPVAWMGGKRRYARAILDAMGVPEEPPARVLLADAGPWGWVWPLLLDRSDAARVAAVLRSWSEEHPRELWQRLVAVPPAEDVHERAAQWLWLQARSASGVPIWWDGWRHVAPNGRGGVSAPHFNTGQAARDGWTEEERARGCRVDRQADPDEGGLWLASDGRGQPRPAGARAVGGRWEAADHDTGRTQAAPQADRGEPGWRMGKTEGREADQRAWQKGQARRRTGGMVNQATIASRIEALAEAFARVMVTVHHGNAGDVLAEGEAFDRLPGGAHGSVWCYLDPPYVGATGYGWDMPRAEVLALARRWADAGAVVAVSEAEPLDLPGWHHLELTREGGKPEWLTLSRAPARVPARQGVLFAPEDA